MVLNYIWIAFFICAFVVATAPTDFLGRHVSISGDNKLYIRFIENSIRNIVRTDRSIGVVDGNYAHRRKRRRDKHAVEGT